LKNYLFTFLLFVVSFLSGQENYTINGYIADANDGESLIGATVFIREISGGNATNVYGFYSITIPPGEYTIEYRYIGYTTQIKTISLRTDQRMDVELVSDQVVLEAVVVTAEPEDVNVSGVEMSTAEMSIETIRKIPSFLGEVDVIKSLQMLPGVSSVGEGSSGFNVRGGSVGQNLVILDEAPVYNTSHMLGFFSVFNPDAVKDVKLYKGGIPPKFGGRIASILDIRMKEGNSKKMEANGGIGSIFSRLAIEGPLKKERSSFILAGRRSYIDVLAKPFTDALDGGAALYFYDLTAKANYNFSDQDRLYLSGYFGRDVFNFDESQGINWGSKTLALRWNHLYNQRLFSNLTFFVSDYDYELAFGDDNLDRFEWSSNITTLNFKSEFTYFINPESELTFGGEVIKYQFEPANAKGVSLGEVTKFDLPNKHALEYALHVGNEQKIGDKTTVLYGLRFSGYDFLGPGNYFEFGDTLAGFRPSVDRVSTAKKGVSIQNYLNLEPRVSMKYSLTTSASVKASYNRTVQYIHLISNTTASNPLDIWTPSTNNLQPQIGDQVAVGLFKNFKDNDFETSAEIYYRETQNQSDYIDGAELFINEEIEGDLLSGIGRAYGFELYAKKNEGRVTGWVSYTLAKTELKIDGVNFQENQETREGKWYPARYDQTHNLKVAAFYELNARTSLSANFSYLTGTPTTFPTHRYEVQGMTIPENANDSRNNLRIPDYHRLDFSITRQGRKVSKKGKVRKNQDSWVITFYNLYNRKNPFSIYFAQQDERYQPGELPVTEGRQVSILGSIVPSFTYNFHF